MPKIITSKGVLKYKSIPIYEGIKQINKSVAAENLALLKDILDDCGISFMLIFGTLLGAIRDNDFIEHDEDIDLAFLDEDRPRVFDSLHILAIHGFEIARYDRRDLLSISRGGEYIDLYFFRKYTSELRCSSGWLVPECFLLYRRKYRFMDHDYHIPQDYEGFLTSEYGENWRIPMVWNNYQLPGWRIAYYHLKAWLKDYLPDAIYYVIAAVCEYRLRQRCMSRLNKYYFIPKSQRAPEIPASVQQS